MRQIRPAKLRRSWLFVGGADEAQLITAADSNADVLIHELEDFTAPSQRAKAREISPSVLAAWKGRGAITRVDVSKDGGMTWETARLAKPGEKMALARFYLDTDWDGSEMLLQSRAMDDTGYIQPTKAQLREVRGLNSIYHNNCIQTWLVRENGEAENVEVS